MSDERARRAQRRWLRPAALGLAVAVVGVGLSVGLAPGWAPDLLSEQTDRTESGSEPAAGEPTPDVDDPDAPEPDGVDDSAGDVAPPSSVHIPAIGVEEELDGLGLQDDGAMEVPDFGDAGWYEPGPAPGEAGGAVIAAHYDSVDGPDVFYELTELEPGDEVLVAAEDGRTGVWHVADSERTPKEALPSDRIWPDTEEPRLALITCGGVFDSDTGHYTHNEVVYAEWQGWQ